MPAGLYFQTPSASIFLSLYFIFGEFICKHRTANIVLPDHPHLTQSWIKSVEMQHKSPPQSVEAGRKQLARGSTVRDSEQGSKREKERERETSSLKQSQKAEQRSFKSRGNLKAAEIQLLILRGLI